jgi:hypothetical protein
MEVLKPKPKLLLPLSFELNQEHYLWELSRKKYCNKTALGVALTTAAVSNGLIIEENEVFMSRIRPDINYCKIYILNIDEIEVYQASISDFLVAKIRAKESFNGVLVFDFLGNASELINEEVTFCWMRDYDFLPGYNMSTPKNQKEHQTVGKLIKLMQLGFICWVLSSFTGNLIFSLMTIYLFGTYFIGGVVWGAAKDAGHTDNFKQMIGYGIHAISWPIWIFGTHDFFRLKRHRNK